MTAMSRLGQSESQRSAVIDLFAGPGGWDLGARALGIDPLGIEWDDAACETRQAAGLRTMQADVAGLSPRGVAAEFTPWPMEPLWGLIASPPCQAWSMAGKGGGRRDKDHVVRCAGELVAGADTRAEHAEQCEDPRSILVVEPLRWALALQPEWVAFEQVPPVLELWSMFAQILALRGYSTWTGVLEAERYGVPQTRERAILLARRSGAVAPPRPTHQRYVPGEPQRHDHTLDGEILPWVSMADALGWDGGALRLNRGEGMLDRHGPRRDTPMREPAPCITSKARSASWVLRTGQLSRVGGGVKEYERPMTEPAPTVLTTARCGWVFDRPATTVAGDPRIWPPGHKKNADDERAGRDGYGDRAGTDAVRVTIEQASILQTFPPDYPWQGTKTKQFEQVGNAVPPLLALHVVSAVTGLEIPTREEVADAA